MNTLENYACQIIGEISPRSLDSIMAVGEKLSCLFMTALMKDHGLNAVYINLQDVIPLSYDFQKGFDDSFYQFYPKKLVKGFYNVIKKEKKKMLFQF